MVEIDERIFQFLTPYLSTELEELIISILLTNSRVPFDKFSLMLKRNQSFTGNQIKDCLRKLTENGWVIEYQEKIYKLNSFSEIKQIIDKKIEKTQEELIEQKKNYHNLVQLLKKIEDHQSFKKILDEIELIKIPEKYPEFLKQKIIEMQQLIPSTVFSFEKSNIVNFPLIKLSFRLLSFEIKQSKKENLTIGGVYLCEVLNLNDSVIKINQIHEYHWKNLNIRYKLEEGGYYEKNHRQISNFHPSDISYFDISKSWKVSKFDFKNSDIIETGCLQTYQKILNKKYILTIFGETTQILNYLSGIIYI